MSSSAYYNELDSEKAEWIRELIKAGVIAPGDVDERSISDVRPDDLRGYTQCHFFAGIGVWSYALRLAGWPDDREVWTGSCPCPSFSCAGKGEGFDDPRHLWPEWFRLIRERRPGTVFGEQVNAAIGHGWLDLVSGDMEAEGYALAAAVLGAHSAGAPHIRQRLYFVAECSDSIGVGEAQGRIADGRDSATGDGSDTGGQGLQERQRDGGISRQAMGTHSREATERPSDTRNGGDADLSGAARFGKHSGEGAIEGRIRTGLSSTSESVRAYANRIGATRGFWADCDWWYGRDGKYRPIKPGIQPLAHGVAGRVLKLRGAGDAICAETAKAFIASYLQIGQTQL